MGKTKYTPEKKAELALEAYRGDRTLNEIASENKVAPTMLSKWKTLLVKNSWELFVDNAAKERKAAKERAEETERLYAEIGRLTAQLSWLKKSRSELTLTERRDLVDRENGEFSITKQCELLGLNRAGLYYKPVPPTAEDLKVKRQIDEIYTAHPEYGSRRITVCLNNMGIKIGRDADMTHMHEMGIESLSPGPHTSKPQPGPPVYPYLLGGLDIVRPNQVWSTDITYIPCSTSWLYLVAIIDWYSRYIVSWRLNDTLEIPFVLECCEEALDVATPEIMNSDQGSHFTSPQYLNLFLQAGSRLSMDHKGRAFDNIRIERFWRTVKYEDVYLHDYATPREVRIGLTAFMEYYNCERRHSQLDYQTPRTVYEGTVII